MLILGLVWGGPPGAEPKSRPCLWLCYWKSSSLVDYFFIIAWEIAGQRTAVYLYLIKLFQRVPQLLLIFTFISVSVDNRECFKHSSSCMFKVFIPRLFVTLAIRSIIDRLYVASISGVCCVLFRSHLLHHWPVESSLLISNSVVRNIIIPNLNHNHNPNIGLGDRNVFLGLK